MDSFCYLIWLVVFICVCVRSCFNIDGFVEDPVTFVLILSFFLVWHSSKTNQSIEVFFWQKISFFFFYLNVCFTQDLIVIIPFGVALAWCVWVCVPSIIIFDHISLTLLQKGICRPNTRVQERDGGHVTKQNKKEGDKDQREKKRERERGCQKAPPTRKGITALSFWLTDGQAGDICQTTFFYPLFNSYLAITKQKRMESCDQKKDNCFSALTCLLHLSGEFRKIFS
jgi:hypothetical protein